MSPYERGSLVIASFTLAVKKAISSLLVEAHSSHDAPTSLFAPGVPGAVGCGLFRCVEGDHHRARPAAPAAAKWQVGRNGKNE